MTSEPENSRPSPSGNTSLETYVLFAALGTLSLGAMLGGVHLAGWLQYERHGLFAGEVWRVVTGHIVHLGWEHLSVNLGGLFLISILFGQRLSMAHWAIVIAGCALGISAALFLFHPDIFWYAGMSGLLHGMFAAGAIASLYAGYRAEWLLLGLLVLKLLWEQFYGALPGGEELVGTRVAVEAHLYGALAGLLIISAILALSRNRPSRRT